MHLWEGLLAFEKADVDYIEPDIIIHGLNSWQ